MRIEHAVKPCPDCGRGELRFFRERAIYDSNGRVVCQNVYGYCDTCDWRTGIHKRVKEVVDEWNSTDLYPEISNSQ